MADLALQFGGDLEISQTGDLAIVESSLLVQQRVMRRLLTNPSQYIWQINYGAGLGQFVGQAGNPNLVSGLIRKQLQLESQVMKEPAPSVTASMTDGNTLTVSIDYVESETNETSQLSFSV